VGGEYSGEWKVCHGELLADHVCEHKNVLFSIVGLRSGDLCRSAGQFDLVQVRQLLRVVSEFCPGEGRMSWADRSLPLQQPSSPFRRQTQAAPIPQTPENRTHQRLAAELPPHPGPLRPLDCRLSRLLPLCLPLHHLEAFMQLGLDSTSCWIEMNIRSVGCRKEELAALSNIGKADDQPTRPELEVKPQGELKLSPRESRGRLGKERRAYGPNV
jgi:hypothetical protein